MALRELGQGLVKGLTPYVQERGEERRLKRTQDIDYKRLEKLASLEFEKKILLDRYSMDQNLSLLKQAGVQPDIAIAMLLGKDRKGMGMLTPLEKEREQAEVGRIRQETSTGQAREKMLGEEASWYSKRPGTTGAPKLSPEDQNEFKLDMAEITRLSKRIAENMPQKVKYTDGGESWEGDWNRVKADTEKLNRLFKKHGMEEDVITVPEGFQTPQDKNEFLQELMRVRTPAYTQEQDDPFGLMPELRRRR